MTIRRILPYPARQLKRRARLVDGITDEIRELAGDMIETMYDAPGIGLAAPQVGVGLRLAVIEMAGNEDERDPLVLINPEILDRSSDVDVASEGCLSLPGFFIDITRPVSVELRFLDLDGVERELALEGLQARCAQHEIDHLNGKLIIDHLSRLKRGIIVAKYKKERAASKQKKSRMG
ncbi:MAG: peptide deformylase [Rhodobacteraceae bacterium]|nr:peptide deformylase [Paracoccaceae bacterium]